MRSIRSQWQDCRPKVMLMRSNAGVPILIAFNWVFKWSLINPPVYLSRHLTSPDFSGNFMEALYHSTKNTAIPTRPEARDRSCWARRPSGPQPDSRVTKIRELHYNDIMPNKTTPKRLLKTMVKWLHLSMRRQNIFFLARSLMSKSRCKRCKTSSRRRMPVNRPG